METYEEIQAWIEQQLGPPRTDERDRHNWTTACVCGHVARYHSGDIGGEWVVPDPRDRSLGGELYREIRVSVGCTGAMPLRGFEAETTVIDREAKVITITRNPTCPCREFRPVAEIDRANRYWNQRVFPDRHPFAVGMRAFTTHITRLKRAEGDPDWAAAEFLRRFRWMPEARRCSITKCAATGEGVAPTYVNAKLDSEMRCPKHR